MTSELPHPGNCVNAVEGEASARLDWLRRRALHSGSGVGVGSLSTEMASVGSRGVLMAVLDRIGCCGVIFDGTGAIVDFNESTRRLITSDQLTVGDAGATMQEMLQDAAVKCLRGSPLVTLERGNGRPIVMTAVMAGLTGETLAILADLASGRQPTTESLRLLFGLTAAEARLAAGMAIGLSTAELAVRLHVSRTTIRSQLATIFMKTNTRRQGELISLLSRIAFLAQVPSMGGFIQTHDDAPAAGI